MNDIAAPAPVLAMPSSRMAEFLLSLTADGLPRTVVHDARIRLLDSLGCGLFGSTAQWSRIAAEVVYEEQSHGRATIYGYRDAVAPARAALVNGTGVHAFELDDAAPGSVHPGSVVVPAVLATVEQFELSGARLLLGLVAGYEAASRTGKAIGKMGWGFHMAGIGGVVGAAVGSGVALGISHDHLMRAIGIACSNAAGIKSFIQGTGGMVKRLHPGRAAESGVLACLLARRGFTAPLAALDGKFGLLETYGGANANPKELDGSLGANYVVSRTKTKAYPFCYGIHTMAQALYELRVEHAIEHASIKSVHVGTNKRSVATHPDKAPKETMAAQYSMPFVAAVSLASDPLDPRAFSGDALDVPAVCNLAQRVELHLDAEMEAVPHGAHVEVRLGDGRVLKKTVLHAKGTPENSCTEVEIKNKFRRLASISHTEQAVAEILSLVERVETLPSVAPLAKVLRSGIRTEA